MFGPIVIMARQGAVILAILMLLILILSGTHSAYAAFHGADLDDAGSVETLDEPAPAEGAVDSPADGSAQAGAGQQGGPPQDSFAKKVNLWIHILLVSFWVGSHLFLLFVFPRSLLKADNYPERVHAVYKGFSRLIIPAFALLVLTGFGNVVLSRLGAEPPEPGSPAAEAMTNFLRLFIIPKLSLAVVAAIVGAVTSFLLIPRLKRVVEAVRSTNDGGDEAVGRKVASQIRKASVINLLVGVTIIFVAVRGLL